MLEPLSTSPRAMRRARIAALITGAAVVVATLFAFMQKNPLADGYVIHAEFSSSAQLHDGGEVRVSGVRVGEVTKIKLGEAGYSLVTMEIAEDAPPVNSNARLTIKPRLALEGNAYIDLKPGSPSAGDELASGSVIPAKQTATSPQLDELLLTFPTPVRDSLHRGIAGLAEGLGPADPGATGAGSDLATGSGARSLRKAVRELDSALGPVSRVARAARGTEPGDLARSVSSMSELARELAEDPRALAGIVEDYNRVFAALSARDRQLADSVSEFAALMRTAPEPLTEIDAALPEVVRLGRLLQPAMRVAPSALRSGNELLDEIGAAVRPHEVPAVLDDLEPLLADLPPLERSLRTMFKYSDPVTRCVSSHIVPTLNMRIEDDMHTTGDPVYLDAAHAFAGLTGLASAVDANGGTVRFGIRQSGSAVSAVIPSIGEFSGRAGNLVGVRPRWLGYGRYPESRPDQPCAEQELPKLNVPVSPLPEWATDDTVIDPIAPGEGGG